MASFYGEIGSIQDAIKEFNDNVAKIGDLHSRSLNNTDDMAAQRVQSELDRKIDETSALSSDLKRRIQTLARQGGAGRDGQIKRQQTQLVKEKFKEAIQGYQQVEQQFRQRYKQRMERQFKIVKPDASPEEVKAVVEDTSGGQVFQQAVCILLIVTTRLKTDRHIAHELESPRCLTCSLPRGARASRRHQAYRANAH
jgi:syntaxin 1B/2/3